MVWQHPITEIFGIAPSLNFNSSDREWKDYAKLQFDEDNQFSGPFTIASHTVNRKLIYFPWIGPDPGEWTPLDATKGPDENGDDFRLYVREYDYIIFLREWRIDVKLVLKSQPPNPVVRTVNYAFTVSSPTAAQRITSIKEHVWLHTSSRTEDDGPIDWGTTLTPDPDPIPSISGINTKPGDMDIPSQLKFSMIRPENQDQHFVIDIKIGDEIIGQISTNSDLEIPIEILAKKLPFTIINPTSIPTQDGIPKGSSKQKIENKHPLKFDERWKEFLTPNEIAEIKKEFNL